MDLAFKYYERALAINPRHRGAHEYVGEAYLSVNTQPRRSSPSQRWTGFASSRARNTPIWNEKSPPTRATCAARNKRGLIDSRPEPNSGHRVSHEPVSPKLTARDRRAGFARRRGAERSLGPRRSG